jgi:hypothetical protein
MNRRSAVISGGLTLALGLSGCAMTLKKEEKAAEAMPVNCATADGDIRVLQSEKAHVGGWVRPVGGGFEVPAARAVAGGDEVQAIPA